MEEDQQPKSEFLERVRAYREMENESYVPPPPPPPAPEPSLILQFIRRSLLAIILIFIAIQIVPYGHDHSNPAATEQPNWDSQTTWQLAVRACFDCHSNSTIWPWYSYVAPVSWVVQHDVAEGRAKMNFSEWDRSQRTAREAGNDVRAGRMPLWYYTFTHSQAHLNPLEVRDLASGLDATIGRKR